MKTYMHPAPVLYSLLVLAVFVAETVSAYTYTWKNSVSSGNWTDPENWTVSVANPDAGYPNNATNGVSFTGSVGEKIVNINGDFPVKSLTVNITGLSLTFAGQGTNDSRIALSANIALDKRETFVLDNVYLGVNNITFGANNTLRLQNGAHFKLTTGPTLGASTNRWELLGGSTLRINSNNLSFRGVDNTIHIEDATLSISGSLYPGDVSSALNNVVEFSGTRPKLIVSSVIPGKTSAPASGVMPVFRFDIPASGYEDVPITLTSTTAKFPSTSSKIAIRCEVPAGAGCFTSAGTKRYKLAGTAKGLSTSWLDFSDQPRPDKTRFYYTYGKNDFLESDGNDPTGLWVEVKGSGATVLLIL